MSYKNHRTPEQSAAQQQPEDFESSSSAFDDSLLTSGAWERFVESDVRGKQRIFRVILLLSSIRAASTAALFCILGMCVARTSVLCSC